MLQFFGCEDSVVNTTALIHDRIRVDDCFKFQENGLKDLKKRFFTVQGVTHTETLIFPFSEIDQMKRDFRFTGERFFKTMMLQTQKLLYFMNKALMNREDCSSLG